MKQGLKEYEGDPKEVCISPSPPFTNDSLKNFHRNCCLNNAFQAAKITKDRIVEGILLVLDSRGIVRDVEQHCWNKKNISEEYEEYYDVTHDYVWSEEEFKIDSQKELGENVKYKYFACNDYDIKDCNLIGIKLEFKYSYKLLKDFFLKNWIEIK